MEALKKSLAEKPAPPSVAASAPTLVASVGKKPPTRAVQPAAQKRTGKKAAG